MNRDDRRKLALLKCLVIFLPTSSPEMGREILTTIPAAGHPIPSVFSPVSTPLSRYDVDVGDDHPPYYRIPKSPGGLRVDSESSCGSICDRDGVYGV